MRAPYNSRLHGTRSTFVNHKCRCDPCREANNSYMRERHASKPKARQQKARELRRRSLSGYGLTEDRFEEMVDTQKGRCAICHEAPKNEVRLCVDHNHLTGKVRALLCRPCNLALGNMADDPDRLRQAAAYLEEHQ